MKRCNSVEKVISKSEFEELLICECSDLEVIS